MHNFNHFELLEFYLVEFDKDLQPAE